MRSVLNFMLTIHYHLLPVLRYLGVVYFIQFLLCLILKLTFTDIFHPTEKPFKEAVAIFVREPLGSLYHTVEMIIHISSPVVI